MFLFLTIKIIVLLKFVQNFNYKYFFHFHHILNDYIIAQRGINGYDMVKNL